MFNFRLIDQVQVNTYNRGLLACVVHEGFVLTGMFCHTVWVWFVCIYVNAVVIGFSDLCV